MKIKTVWARKIGHLWQVYAQYGTKAVYGYGITRKQAGAQAKARLTK